jgi:hypothetical protein
MNYSDEEYRNAVKEVKERRGFYQHLVIYIMVCVFLSAMSLFVWRGTFWPIFVIFGWGIGVASHAVATFLGKEWERRKVKEYLEKHSGGGPKAAEGENGADDESENIGR